MPDFLRALVDLSSPGELIGPIEIEGYCLFQVEQFLPASLEGQVKQELQNQLLRSGWKRKCKAHHQAAGEFMIVNDIAKLGVGCLLCLLSPEQQIEFKKSS